MRPTNTSNNSLKTRTLRRIAMAAVTLFVFYLILIGGFVLGVREYYWQTITLIILTIVGGGWLWSKIQGASIPVTGLEYPLLLMLSMSIVATIFSTDPRLSAGRLALNFLLIPSLYFTLDWLQNDWRADLLINALLITGGIVVVIGLVEYWQWYAGGWVSPVSWRETGVNFDFNSSLRIKSVLHNPNYLAYFLITIIGLSFYKLFNASHFWVRGLWGGYLLVTLITMILTKSRGGLMGGMVAIFIGAVLLMVPHLTRRSFKQSMSFFRSILFVLLTVLSGAALLYPIIIRTDFTNTSTFNLRDDIWQGSRDIFLHYWATGIGPATFPTQYFVFRNSAGSTAIFTHAHNVWLTIAAEYGVLGLLSVIIFFAVLGLMIWRYLRRNPAHRWSMMLVAGLSILAGQAAHNLVDDFMEFPIFSWFTVFAIALCLRPIQSTRSMPIPMRRSWLLIAIVGIASVMAGTLWYGQAFAAYERARAASMEGNWRQAVDWLEKAIDRDPNYRFYHQQLALAYGELARSDERYLRLALDQQLRVYPHSHYAPDAAYIGCLYWHLNQPDQAVRWMRLAVNTTPKHSGGLHSYHLGQATYYFNLGHYLEANQRNSEAREAYQAVIETRPAVSTSVYWQVNRSRHLIVREFIESAEPYPLHYKMAVNALANNDLSEAEVAIKRGIALTATESEPSYNYLWGKLAELHGNRGLAVEKYQAAIAGSTTIRTDYANLVGQRQPLAIEKPFCLLIPYPAEYLSAPSLELARLRYAEHELMDAKQTYERVLRYEPYNSTARRRLTGILLEENP